MADDTRDRDALAEVLCLHDDTMFHHDRTDDFPCSACKGKADAASDWLRDIPLNAIAAWTNPDAKAITCTWCHAQPGEDCTGPAYPAGRSHSVREDDARQLLAKTWRGETTPPAADNQTEAPTT